MTTTSIRPRSPQLAPFVESIDYYENDTLNTLERILPSGRVHVLVNLYEDEFRTYDAAHVTRTTGAVLEGPASHARVIDTRLQRCLVAVNFKLGGGAPFFRVPLSEAHDQLVDLDLFWGRDGATLRERLLDAKTPAAKLAQMEDVLLAQLSSHAPVDASIPRAAAALDRGASVAHSANALGLLQKTFIRRFSKYTGLTPKRFARVRRFQRVIAAIDDPASADWCELASTHGYVDQSHLIHDFRQLTGLTPTAYRPRSAEARNHVLVEARGD